MSWRSLAQHLLALIDRGVLGFHPMVTDEQVREAMRVMDEGYLAQDYYSSKNAMIKLTLDREESYDFTTYSWTEHICRKIGQWNPDPEPMVKGLKGRGIDINKANP